MTSIRRRLLVGLLALVITIDALAVLLCYRRALVSTATVLDYQLRQTALSLRDQGAAIADVHLPPADDISDYGVQIWNKDGTLIYASRPDVPQVTQPSDGYTNLVGEDDGWRAFVLQTAERVILVAQPFQVREQLARRLALRAIAPLLIAAPILAIAIWWIVIRTLAPIKSVVGEVRRRDADSLSPVQVARLPQEIEPLIAEVNRLLARLSEAFRTQRAFIADAAHELRSPLTALRVQLQLFARTRDEADRSRIWASLSEAMDRASSLVQQLLTLARNEPGADASVFAPLVLDAIVRDGVAECATFAVSRGTDLSLDAEPGIEVKGDADSLRTLVRNLVDNAIRYSPPAAKVAVRIALDGEAARLEVEDSGPGLGQADRQRVFDRFYRGADAAGSGSGLGLAIVKSIATRHRAAIALGSSEFGGLKVTVVLPIHSRPPGV